MALETLEDVKELGGVEIAHIEKEVKPGDLQKYIIINHHTNAIAFCIQNGPIKEVGINGCQIDALVHAYREILVGLNEKFSCEENAKQIDLLNEVLALSEKRKRDRLERGVEGLNKE